MSTSDPLDALARLDRPSASEPTVGLREGAETPALLAVEASRGHFTRTRLWALFDRLALAMLRDEIENLIVTVPVQHGKSLYWSNHFPAWWLSNNPEHRIILASYGAQYAAKWGRRCRDLVKANGKLLGLQVRDDVTARGEWELRGHEGGMIAAGFEGGISGRSAELAIVDDPFADIQAASSAIERERIFEWWENELSTRLQRGGRRVVVMTRRHTDDLIGRLLELDRLGRERWTVVRLPALAEENELWPRWAWSRKAGEALVPELHDEAELERTKLARSPYTWATLYQQAPFAKGGGTLKSEWFRVVHAQPTFSTAVRAWDLAGSESRWAARTAGVLLSRRFEDNVRRFHVRDVVVGRWNPGERDRVILETAQRDGRSVPIIFEQEPGSGGKAQVEALIGKLAGWTARAVPASGSKELRADPLAAQAAVGNVTVFSAHWTQELLGEVDGFPEGTTVDIIDALAHAFNYLADADEIVRVGVVSSIPNRKSFFANMPRRFFG